MTIILNAVEDRLQAFRDIASERSASIVGLSAEMRAAYSDHQFAQARLRELERDGLKDNPSFLAARDAVDRADQARAKLVTRIEKLSPGSVWARRLTDNLEAYVRAHSAAGISMYEGALPQLLSGETALDGMERAARRSRALKADRREVLAAPFPAALAKKTAWEQLQSRANAARPDVSIVVDRLGAVKFPTKRIEQYGGSSDLFAVDPVGLLTLIAPDLMRSFIDREIDAVADDEAALSATDRIERLAEIEGDLLASEREEVTFAEMIGQLPRWDADPRAVLGLASSMPAPDRD
ncbi:hypothetical protein ACVIGA_000911 [Bradyrhizobium sp. USDA 3240]